MWGKYGIRRMPTFMAYNGKKCPDPRGYSGSSFKSALDQCGGGGSSPSPPTSSPRRRSPSPSYPRRRSPSPAPRPSGGASTLRNGGRDCWGACRKGGYCSWCGQGNACCRRGWGRDPPECRNAIFSNYGGHHCVALRGGGGGGPSPPPPPPPPSGGSSGGWDHKPGYWVAQSSSNYLSSCPRQHGFYGKRTSRGTICAKQSHSQTSGNDAKAICGKTPGCKAVVTTLCRG